MNAIDFTMSVERIPVPKGNRVGITMSGKFLGYQKW
jgi:cyanate lyase